MPPSRNLSKSLLADDTYSNSSSFSNYTLTDENFGYLYLEHNYGMMVLTALVIGAAAIIGTLGNILIILTICLVRTLRTCGNFLVLNLSLADLVVTVLIDPFNVIGAVAGRKYLIENQSLCDWIASFCAPACMCSMWNMCAISLNRYVLICQPHLYPRIFTFPKTIAYCVSIWVLAHLLHMPNHLGWGKKRFNKDYYICTFDIILHSYAIFYVITGVIIPLVGVLFGYTNIFLKVRAVKSQLRKHQSRQSVNSSEAGAAQRIKKPGYTQDDIKLAKTLFAAFVVFLICWLPFAILVLAHQPSQTPSWLYVVAIIMAHGNSAVNPILYGATNEKFRDGYRQVLGGTAKIQPLQTSNSIKQRANSQPPDGQGTSSSPTVANDTKQYQTTKFTSILDK